MSFAAFIILFGINISANAARKSVENDSEFQFQMGCKFYSPTNRLRDYREAVHWLTKAAKQGHVKAQGMLGLCHFSGRGTPLNFKQAAYWLNLAADKNDPVKTPIFTPSKFLA